MAKIQRRKIDYIGYLLCYFYINRVLLRRINYVGMQVSFLSFFFFLLGMYQRFTTDTRYMLLDITRYVSTFVFVNSVFMILLRLFVKRYHKIRRVSYVLIDLVVILLMLVLVILSSTLRVWLGGRLSDT